MQRIVILLIGLMIFVLKTDILFVFSLPAVVNERKIYQSQMVRYKTIYYRIGNKFLTFLLKIKLIKQRKAINIYEEIS